MTSPAVHEFALETMHRSLRAPLRYFLNGSGLLFLLTWLLLILWPIFSPPRAWRMPEPMAVVAASGSTPTEPRLSPHEKRLQQLLAEAEAELESIRARSQADLPPVPEGHVRVAAVQFMPIFAKPKLNRTRLRPFVERAAQEGAKIVILPELAIQGYADMNKDIAWTRGAPEELFAVVTPYAETAEDETMLYFRELARELKIYLTAPLLERVGANLYSTVFLLNPEGEIILTERKRQLAETWDKKWATSWIERPQTVQTPLGRIALVVGYDLARVLPVAAQENADHVLWCAAWRGDNLATLLNQTVRPHAYRANTNLVFANWAMLEAWWQGHGHTRIIGRNGKTLNLAGSNEREMLVIADLPLARDPRPAPTTNPEESLQK